MNQKNSGGGAFEIILLPGAGHWQSLSIARDIFTQCCDQW